MNEGEGDAATAGTWTAVLPSADAPSGAIVGVDHGERELVVWRTLEGDPVVMDARCPHQWSHLEAEGFLDGDEIVCTAHFWRFDAAGCGSKLSVLGRRDPKGDIRVHPCRERDGMVEARLDP